MKSFHFSDTALITPPLVPYELIYYITKVNYKIMIYHQTPVKGNYYISNIDFAVNKKVLYSFYDKTNQQQLCLFAE
jgi:hypothetical protein